MIQFTRKHQLTLPTSNLYVNNHHAFVETNHSKYLGFNLFPDLFMVSPHCMILYDCMKTKKFDWYPLYTYLSTPRLLKVIDLNLSVQVLYGTPALLRISLLHVQMFRTSALVL